MAKLDSINENSPQGSDLISNDEAARQRELRANMVETFEVEHHLTGEHKFPSATTTPSTLTDGQLHLNTLDNGLLTLSGQSFPVGSVRDFLMNEGRTLNGNIMTSYANVKGPTLQLLGSALPANDSTTGIRWGQGSEIATPHRRVFFSTLQLATWEAVVGTYQLRAHCRFFNGTTGTKAMSAVDGTLKVFSSHQSDPILSANGFTGTYDVTNVLIGTVGSVPPVFNRRDLGVSTFSVSAAGEYTLRAEVTGSDRLGITALSLRIERIK